MAEVMTQEAIDKLLAEGIQPAVKKMPENFYICAHCGKKANIPSLGAVKIFFCCSNGLRTSPCSNPYGHEFVAQHYWGELLERRKRIRQRFIQIYGEHGTDARRIWLRRRG